MKYVVDNVPAAGAGAFMPVLSAVVSPKASTYGMISPNIVGNPGNRAIASPKPSALPGGPLTPGAQPSNNSPDVFYPSVYYEHITGLHPANSTMRVKSTNEVPIPAKNVVRNPQVAYRRPRFGGIRQVTWPAAPQAWQNVNTGATGG